MARQLSKEQVLLLNNLMYMGNNAPLQSIRAGGTVGQWINSLDIKAIQDEKEYSTFTTGKEWKNLITAIQKDPDLMNLQIVQTKTDNGEGGGGGLSALFVNPETSEAIVTFCGTASGEWKDNFLGGTSTDAPDGVSTVQQSNAMEWYQTLNLEESYNTITVTGHSKGGNKAKYITILDDSVDRCISFDGQGFSDEFIDKYSDQISQNQSKIENHNAESDYVNLLLNDVGETSFYKEHDIGKGGLIENHCPNTLLGYQDGIAVMEPGSRDPRMAELDRFLNGYLRSLPPDSRAEALNLVGEMVELGFNYASFDEFIKSLTTYNNTDHVTNLISYLMAYSKQNENFLPMLNSLLSDLGFNQFTNVINVLDVLIDNASGILSDLLNDGIGLVKGLPNFVLEWIIEKLGIDISVAQLRELLKLMDKIDPNSIHIKDGSDKRLPDIASSGGAGKRVVFCVYLPTLRQSAQALSKLSCRLREQIDGAERTARALDAVFGRLRREILEECAELEQRAAKFDQLRQTLEEIIDVYQSTEQSIVDALDV